MTIDEKHTIQGDIVRRLGQTTEQALLINKAISQYRLLTEEMNQGDF